MKRKLRHLAIPARYFSLSIILLLFVFCASAQKQVSGTIKENNNPVVGATVEVKGTNVATISGPQGTFVINVPAGKSILVISYVGLETQEVNIADKTTVDVVLVAVNTTLNEVVVTGYTSQAKKGHYRFRCCGKSRRHEIHPCGKCIKPITGSGCRCYCYPGQSSGYRIVG